MTATLAVSIVVPAYREVGNLRALTERVFAATRGAGFDAELIVVDDNSRDGTEELAAELSKTFPIRLITRTDERGLSSAVVRGLSEAKNDILVVLDADLQHPPESIPAMVVPLAGGEADFVIATRYAGGGGIEGDWPAHRRLVSRVASALARPLTPLSDPMSGFFALRRETFAQANDLSPQGFKIALEIYVKAGCSRPVEVPIQFAARRAGESKLGAKEMFRYLRHLRRLYLYRFPKAIAMSVVVVFVVIFLILAKR